MAKKNTNGGEIMSTAEVCAALDISRTTLYNWIHEGLIKPLPPLNPTKRQEARRFNRADVERLRKAPPARKPTTRRASPPRP